MKKQILFLTFFVAAILAGMNSYGQDLTANPTLAAGCPAVNTLTCLVGTADTHLYPLAGKEYIYEVAVPTSSSGGTGLVYNWLVTTDKTFIGPNPSNSNAIELIASVETNDGTGTHILAAGSASAAYNNQGGNGAVTLPVTWKMWTDDPTNPVFLVVYVTDDNGVCLTDNIEVWRITPVFAFTLDIANLTDAGAVAAANYATCVSPIQSAEWVPGGSNPPGQLNVDYGTNYLYFAVTAANWVDAWRPSVEITATMGARTVAVDWAYASQGTGGAWNTMPLSGAEYVSTDPVLVQDIDGDGDNYVGDAGECIVIRVTIDHNTEETIADLPVQVAVDGVLMTEGTPGSGNFNTVGRGDVHYTGTDCGVEDLYKYDIANQTITQRPDVNEVAPAPTSFIPKVGS